MCRIIPQSILRSRIKMTTESWKRQVSIKNVNFKGANNSRYSRGKTGAALKTANYASYLPAVYTGMTNRVDRYTQYDQMDTNIVINTGLDILADFCTQNYEDDGIPLRVRYKEQMSESEVATIEDRLLAWCELNQFKERMFDIVRGIFKYGDCIFIRDPETLEWIWANPTHLEKVTVNESLGKKPIIYYIKDVSLNLRDKVLTNEHNISQTPSYAGGVPNSLGYAGSQYGSTSAASSGSAGSAFTASQITLPVDADHVIHFSLSTGMDAFWPFGTSILENVFKVYKQVELLEDSVVIYRVQRAPERRVFKIDTGDMFPAEAMSYVEQFKNEIHQKRIPTNRGGSDSLLDAAYNPMCFDMSTRIPLLDGRTLSIAELAVEYSNGVENWVYSTNPETGEMVPGNITWAGVTKTDAEVIRVTLSNGKSFVCTPDHKVPVFGKGFVEAQNLTSDDELIEFKNYSGMVYDYVSGNYITSSVMTGSFFQSINKHQVLHYDPEFTDADKTSIHHKDLDIANNNPSNIQYMNEADHLKMVQEQGIRYVINNEPLETASDFISPEHKVTVVGIERLAETMDVGTITVDGQERWHNFHTFAIESGIFVKNSILEDYFFPQSADGRGSSVETLPGGDNLGQIDDMIWFNDRLVHGMKIPPVYLPYSTNSGGGIFNDGHVGQALVQETRFNKMCQRYQTMFATLFDREFKYYLFQNGYNINSASFEISFYPPMNFSSYRKAELESTMINSYMALNDLSYVSKQMILKKMGWSEDEIIENERLWLQENPTKQPKGTSNATLGGGGDTGLQSVGINDPSDDLNMDDTDMEDSGDMEMEPDGQGGTF